MDTNHNSSCQIQKTRDLRSTSDERTEQLQNEIKNESSTRKPVTIRLEPSLGEKLAKKRAVADELEEKLRTLREKFDEKLILADSTKEELNRRETQLIHSIQKIEVYMQEMYSLKRVAEDMNERFGDMVKELETREQDLLEQCIDASMKRNTAVRLLENFQPVKVYLEDVVYDFPQLSSAKHLVNYFLVLNLLNKDLLEKDRERVEEEERLATERQKIVESSRVHPLTILAKEDSLHRLEAEVKDTHARNVELGQQVDSTTSAKMREDLLWYDTERWISKLYTSTRDALPVQRDGPDEEGALGQLQKIRDFVVMGTKISNRLNDKRAL